MSIRCGLVSFSIVLAVLLAGLWIVVPSGRSNAAECLPRVPLMEEFDESAAVFSGGVKSKTSSSIENASITAEITVRTVWKGPLYETMYVTASNPRTAAGYGMDFAVGDEIVVFSPFMYIGGDFMPNWHVNHCTRTGSLSWASSFLDELGEGEAPILAPLIPRSESAGDGFRVSIHPANLAALVALLCLVLGIGWLVLRNWRISRGY